MKKHKIIVKDIKWGTALDEAPKNSIFFVPTQERFVAEDFCDLTTSVIELVQKLKDILEQKYRLHISGFTIKNLHKVIPGSEKEMAFQWTYIKEGA